MIKEQLREYVMKWIAWKLPADFCEIIFVRVVSKGVETNSGRVNNRFRAMKLEMCTLCKKHIGHTGHDGMHAECRALAKEEATIQDAIERLSNDTEGEGGDVFPWLNK